MQPASGEKRYATFGPYQADLRTGELRKHGIRLRLQEQPFQVLAMLLSTPGDLVTREQLQKRLWSGDTFVDFDHGLNTAINKLREVLSDSSAAPKYIETLPRRGYRFVAAVEFTNGDAKSLPPTDAGAVPSAASAKQEVPTAPRPVAFGLLLLLQAMYLVFYLITLMRHESIYGSVQALFARGGVLVTWVAIVTAVVGMAVRLFFFSGIALDQARIGEIFLRVFLPLMILDELWALSPLLLWRELGTGLALAAITALVWAPFAQRTLVRMIYPDSRGLKA
jgi:DNA-binding winged helix-turn-helix (wHTH) protein